MNVSKRLFRLVMGLACALAIGGAAIAQDDTLPTLREMADASGIIVSATLDVWDIPSHPDFVDTLVTEFNGMAPENHGKMCFIQEREGEFNFTDLDTLVDLAEDNDMNFYGHTLVWHNCVPEWLQNSTPTRDEAIALLETHIKTVVGRYAGRIDAWDVVNEPFEDDGRLRNQYWAEWIGPDYIPLAFQFAHEADPTARLYLNEYDAEAINPKSNALYDLVAQMVRDGVPIDGVGMQMHTAIGEVVEGGVIDPQSFENNIRRIGQLGLEVSITEVDVAHFGEADEDTMRLVAGTYHTLFGICVEWKQFCTRFNTWGLFDGETWLRSPEFFSNPLVAPLLFDEDMQPKLAYTAMLDVLARDQGLTPLLTDEEVAALNELGEREMVISAARRSDPAQLAPDSQNGLLYYAPYPVEITLDGDAADWENVPRDTVFQGTALPEGSPAEVTFAAAADDEFFYFLAEVTDDNIVTGVHPLGEWYREDSVEFYINATGELMRPAYVPGVAQIAIPAANIGHTGEALVAGGGSGGLGVNAVVVETETGYRVEASVPLVTDVWTITPSHESILGFQVHMNGTSGEDRDTKLIWSAFDEGDSSWSNPSVFGQLMFWDRTQP